MNAYSKLNASGCNYGFIRPEGPETKNRIRCGYSAVKGKQAEGYRGGSRRDGGGTTQPSGEATQDQDDERSTTEDIHAVPPKAPRHTTAGPFRVPRQAAVPPRSEKEGKKKQEEVVEEETEAPTAPQRFSTGGVVYILPSQP